MPRTGLKCPKCGEEMTRIAQSKELDPFEVKYRCKKCESSYIFHNWKEYYEACTWEELEKEKKKSKPFNPSIRGSAVS